MREDLLSLRVLEVKATVFWFHSFWAWSEAEHHGGESVATELMVARKWREREQGVEWGPNDPFANIGLWGTF